MKPLPWSHSSLSTFKSCPRKYHAESVIKSVPRRPSSASQLYGLKVHKAFEDFQRTGTALPPDLVVHQRYMDELVDARIAPAKVERKVALDTKLRPCEFFDKNAWWRGVIDLELQIGENEYKLVDYKTGKKKDDFSQLHGFAMYKLCEGADKVTVEFYWTQHLQKTTQHWTKDLLSHLLNSFLPDLTQYREAFRSDIWQPRQNGLCALYCDVTGCEFHGIARGR